jgi:hypothetical protein
MYLSGSVGYTLLKHKHMDKFILLLADIHDGVSYCLQDSMMIDKFLSINDNNDILLEEAVRETFDLKDLWPGAEHTQRLKKLNRTNKKIKPVDIRPLLIKFSWELLESANDNDKHNNMTLEEYLSLIDDIFNFKNNKLMRKYFIPEIKKLDNVNIKIKELILQHYDEMRKLYFDFIKENKLYLNKPIIELYKNKKNELEEINNITSMIMEWYILLLILNSNTNCILHLGLAHSNRILDFLLDVYSFNVIKKSGINMIEEINSNEPAACLMVPDEVNNKFK